MFCPRVLESLFHAKHKLCGLRLRPYNLAAFTTLVAIDSPLVSDVGETPIAFEDFQVAARVCSSPWPFNFNTKKASILEQVSWFFLADNTQAIHSCSKAWQDYVGDYATLPDFFQTASGEGQSKKLSAPWTLSRVGFLVSYCHFSLREAWLTPIDEAIVLSAAVSELRGGSVRFSTPEDAETAAQIDSLGEVPEDIRKKLLALNSHLWQT